MLLVSDPAFSIQMPPVNTQEMRKISHFCAESNAFLHWWKKQILRNYYFANSKPKKNKFYKHKLFFKPI